MTENRILKKDRFYDINKGFATEGDPINCSFYNRIGACKNVASCLKKHIVPSLSKSILIQNIFNIDEFSHYYLINNFLLIRSEIEQSILYKHVIKEFYEEFISKLNTQLTIEEFYICANEASHLQGNVYIKFTSESDAEKALQILNMTYYKNKLIYCEFSPVLDFGEAKCKLFDDGICLRKENCNFLHTFEVPNEYKSLLKICNKNRNDVIGEKLMANIKYKCYLNERVYIEKEYDRLKRIRYNIEKFYQK